MQKILNSFRSFLMKKVDNHFSTEIDLNFMKILKDTVRIYAGSYIFALVMVFNTPDMINNTAVLNFHNIYIYQPSIFFIVYFLSWFSEIFCLMIYKEHHGWITKTRTTAVSKPVSTLQIPFLRRKEASYSQEERLKAQNSMLNSVHEAGHVVAAFLLDVEVEYATASEAYGGATHMSRNFDINFIENLRKAILIDYAASIAEKMVLGFVSGGNFGNNNADFEKARKEIKRYLAQKDFQEHSNVGHVLTYIYADLEASETLYAEYMEPLKKTEQEFYQECTLLLQDHKLLIINIAEELAKRGRLSQEDIESIIHRTMTQFTKDSSQEDTSICDV